jgi:Ca2+-binding EF-hand superfamily protein
MLDLLYWKITERFTRLANAFKFFDSSADGSINFSEFREGLERIRMKIHDSDALKIF